MVIARWALESHDEVLIEICRRWAAGNIGRH